MSTLSSDIITHFTVHWFSIRKIFLSFFTWSSELLLYWWLLIPFYWLYWWKFIFYRRHCTILYQHQIWCAGYNWVIVIWDYWSCLTVVLWCLLNTLLIRTCNCQIVIAQYYILEHQRKIRMQNYSLHFAVYTPH